MILFIYLTATHGILSKKQTMLRNSYLILSLVIFISTVKGQYFTKINTGPLVNSPGDSRSVNWVDVNNDGWVDCFISNGPTGGQNNSLFINDTHGNFTAVINDPIVLDNKPSDGASFADLDNDGDLDAFVVNWYGVNKLMYINHGNGSFTQIDTGVIVNDGGYSETAAWGDYDKDGFVDLYITNSAGDRKNYLYHNNGNSSFTKIITGSMVTDALSSRSVNWTDIDNDGDPDLFVSNENNQNENIYRNDGMGLFTKLNTGPLLTNLGNTMSSSWADIDNDGDLDVFLANDQGFNSLFMNNGSFNFTKLVNDTLVKTPSRSFSSAWSDIDNDGDLDLFVTNAFGTAKKQLNFLYINDGAGHFTRNSSDIVARDSSWSYGCAFGDYDNDGFEDLAVATCRYGGIDYPDFLYHNNGNSNHWITIQLSGTYSNRSGIGTKIRVKAVINGAHVWQMREISAQTSYCGQNDMRVHFGLGIATLIDSIQIEWPRGMIEFYKDIPADQFLHYSEKIVNTTNNSGLNNLEFNVFPNPGSKSISLSLSNDYFHESDQVLICDIHGKVLIRITPIHTRILSIELTKYKLHTGTYFIKLNRNGMEMIRKFILEN